MSGASTYISVDYTNQAPGSRASVRLQSKKLYRAGLFVLGLANMPGGTCGHFYGRSRLVSMANIEAS
jgi:hypothetical protein